MNRLTRLVLVLALTGVPSIISLQGCEPTFDPKIYTDPTRLFAAGMKELKAKHWENAALAFDQLTKDLPPRDRLLPTAFYYLGEAQDQHGDHLLAAQSFARLAESFPEDTLAPRALLQAGFAYAKMWRRPPLDPEYGSTALTTLQTLLSLYPDSPIVPQARTEIAKLDNMLARKDYETGKHYLRRGAYDSAIIYFRDVIRLHPDTPAARDASLHLYDAYHTIKYFDDARDVCEAMQKRYPNDREVVARCGSGSSAAASTPRT